MARDGGVLVRTGHTEAAVDIARLAGLNPSGVICEIMNDDGTMARRADLIAFAQLHGLKIATIADLIAYRRRHDRIVERMLETPFTSQFGGEWKLIIYANKVPYAEHIALVKGDITKGGPVLVRMHAVNMLDDALGNVSNSRRGAAARGDGDDREGGPRRRRALREPTLTILTDRVRSMIAGRAFRAGVARLRHRRADPARSRRARHDAAVQHRAHDRRARRLWPQRRRAAADHRSGKK